MAGMPACHPLPPSYWQAGRTGTCRQNCPIARRSGRDVRHAHAQCGYPRPDARGWPPTGPRMTSHPSPAAALAQHATGCQTRLPPPASQAESRWCRWPRQQAVHDGPAASSNPKTGSARHIRQPLLPAPRCAEYPQARQGGVSGWVHRQSAAATDRFPEPRTRQHTACRFPPWPLPDTRPQARPCVPSDGAPAPLQTRSAPHHARGGHTAYGPVPAPPRRQAPNQAHQPPAPDAANRYSPQDAPHRGAAGENATGGHPPDARLNTRLTARYRHLNHHSDCRYHDFQDVDFQWKNNLPQFAGRVFQFCH